MSATTPHGSASFSSLGLVQSFAAQRRVGLRPAAWQLGKRWTPVSFSCAKRPDRQRIASDQAQRQRSMSPALCWGSHVGNGCCEGRPLCCRRPIHLPRYRATYESAEKPAGDGWLVSDSQQLFCQFKPDMETAHEQWVPPGPPVSDPPADAQGQRDRSLGGDAENRLLMLFTASEINGVK